MPARAANPDFTPIDRPVRAAFVGLGRIYDLNVRAYIDNDDVRVVAIVIRARRGAPAASSTGPRRGRSASIDELAASDVEVDAVEVLLPISLHEDGVIQCLGHGWHVNLQKPMANDLASAQRMLAAARANDASCG